MRTRATRRMVTAVSVASLALACAATPAAPQKGDEKPNSYGPVVIKESFHSIMERMKRAKPQVMRRQQDLLERRYDLSDRPVRGTTMSRGKLSSPAPSP